jgi:hypothetical protein
MNIGKFLKCVELGVEISKDGFNYEVEYSPYLDEYRFDTGSSLYTHYKDNLWYRGEGEDALTLKEWIEQGEEETPNEAWGYPVVRTEARSFNNYKIDAIVVDVLGVKVRLEDYGDYYNAETVDSNSVVGYLFSGHIPPESVEYILKSLELSVKIRAHGFDEMVEFNTNVMHHYFRDSRTSAIYIYAHDDLWCRKGWKSSRVTSSDLAEAKTLEQWAEEYDRMFKLVSKFKAPVPKDSGTWCVEGGLKITTVQVGDKQGVVIVTDEKTVLVVDEETMRFDSLEELNDWLEEDQ